MLPELLAEQATTEIAIRAIRALTPDDATAALEQVEQAAYERGMRKAAEVCTAFPTGLTHYGSEPFEICAAHILALIESDTHPDDLAVDRFASAMKNKLAKKRADGRSGWDDPLNCTAGFLSALLHEHVKKGDPLDVGNLAMMLHQRGDKIESATPAKTHREGWDAAIEVAVAKAEDENYVSQADVGNPGHRIRSLPYPGDSK
jgi:hypothetical protein